MHQPRRVLWTSLLAVCSTMVLACGGGGRNADNQKQQADAQGAAKPVQQAQVAVPEQPRQSPGKAEQVVPKPVAAAVNVYHTPAELFADMPKGKHPASGGDGAPERAECNSWLKKIVVGRSIEWSAVVDSVHFDERGNGVFMSISPLQLEAIHYQVSPLDRERAYGSLFGDVFAVGSERAIVLLDQTDPAVRNRLRVYWYDNVSASSARVARDTKGKMTTYRATILAADVVSVDHEIKLEMSGAIRGRGNDAELRHGGIVFRLSTTPPSINGHAVTEGGK